MPASLTAPMSTSSPLVDTVMARKHQLVVSRDKWKWGLANVMAALAIFFEANATSCHFFVDASSSWRIAFSRAETLLVVVLVTNAVLDFYGHLFPFGSAIGPGDDVVLSPSQMRLFNVSKDDPGFKASPPPQEKPVDRAHHPYGFSPPLDGSFVASTSALKPAYTTSPLNFSNRYSGYLSPEPRPSPNSPSTAQSPEKRRDSSKPKASANGTITDEKSLADYLKEFEVHDGSFSASGDLGPSSPATKSFWNESSTPAGKQDYSPLLKKVAYQLSTPMPFSSSGKPSPGKSPLSLSQSRHKSADTKTESLCRRLGIDPLDLVPWMQNIRVWLSQTILSRVVGQIDAINAQLTDLGLSDTLIGHVGAERLKKLAALHGGPLAGLTGLVPFLEVSVHQDYLVQRLRELADGGAMSAFAWNAGSRFGGADWSEKFPTDADLVMGCLAAYMDKRMPANYRHRTVASPEDAGSASVEDKPFTGVYFVRLPAPPASASSASADEEKASRLALTAHEQQMTAARHSIVILQTSQRPPHFILQLDGGERLQISPGRNNLFHTILFFLHHFKTKENCMLGRISLGPSGVNMMWVID